MTGVRLPLDGLSPWVADTAFVATGAVLVGAVRVDAWASVWFNAVLRGDTGAIEIGTRSNIQDLAVIHEHTYRCGRELTVIFFFAATIHRSVVGDNVLIGMGAVVLSDSRSRRGDRGGGCGGPRRVRGAGRVTGRRVPARVVRPVTEAERESTWKTPPPTSA